ncbi:MAG: matrixin family metalloprotease [Akkermansiaceae bacterium]|nr:matrixin family metalloprotease [Akkermansiaceae bacterium]
MIVRLKSLRLLVPIALVIGVYAILSEEDSLSGSEPDGVRSTEQNLGSADPVFRELQWERFLEDRSELREYRDNLMKVGSRLPLSKFAGMSPGMQMRLAKFARLRENSPLPPFSMCWAPGVAPEVLEAFHAVEDQMGDVPGEPQAATQFDETDRWGRTATYNSFFEDNEQGKPTTLRWSFIPDGTSIFGFNDEPTSDSDLIEFLDARYGVSGGGSDLTTRPWFAVFQAVFDNISELTGVSYIYESNDDGAGFAQFSLPSGSIGTRGDIRIGGHFIDGESGSNTLAYNFSPSAGDMVIDTGNPVFYGNTSSNSLNLRNVVEHEHGHGLALGHVCPINQTKLMEPFISRQFRGLQLDDIFSLNRLYGDYFEKHDSSIRNNDSPGNAAPLVLSVGGSYSRDYLSIDDNSDQDFYLLEDVPSGSLITYRVVPVATPGGFVEGPQNSDGSCSPGSLFDFTSIHDLDIAILSPNGGTVLSQATSEPIGEREEIVSFSVPSTGDYYLRVTGGSANSAQLYTLEVDLAPSPGPPPAAPSGLIADLSISGEVSLSWNDNSNSEDGFEIERKLERDGTWEIYDTAGPDSESYVDIDPAPGINLFYRVTAQGAGGKSDPSGDEIKMVVDLSAERYVYDLGGTQSPVASGAFRVSRQTDGDVSWSGSVTSRDRGGSDLSNRDYLWSSSARTWSHRIANGVWEVSVRQGDEDDPRENMTIAAEGNLVASNLDTATNEFLETTFLVEVEDGSLDLTFDDTGGASDRWVVNRVELNLQTPYQSWAFSEELPGGQSGPEQDADGDGIANVQEYYFGLSPLIEDDAIVIESAPAADASKFEFIFVRDPEAQVGEVVFETSDDLVEWNEFDPSPEEIDISPQGSLERVTLTLSSADDQRYIRIGLSID